MKRLLKCLLSLCIIFSLVTFSATAATNSPDDSTRIRLSSLDNEQCKNFLASQGITIPEALGDIDLPKIFALIEEHPKAESGISWTVASDFIKEVRLAADSYYGISSAPSARALAYTLQYSTVYSWDPATMPRYNCYAYAIGRTSACEPGDFSDQTYNSAAGIDDLAAVVKADLKGDLGYSCVKIQSNRPSSTSGWSNVIAARKDTTYDSGRLNDYHFAKLTSSGWYHKPGDTAILKFNSAPSNSVDWTNERYDGSYHAPFVTYDSDIRYLLYRPNHGSTTYTWTGEHYHSGSLHYYLYAYVCNDCGGHASTVWTTLPCTGSNCVTPWGFATEPEEY